MTVCATKRQLPKGEQKCLRKFIDFRILYISTIFYVNGYGSSFSPIAAFTIIPHIVQQDLYYTDSYLLMRFAWSTITSSGKLTTYPLYLHLRWLLYGSSISILSQQLLSDPRRSSNLGLQHTHQAEGSDPSLIIHTSYRIWPSINSSKIMSTLAVIVKVICRMFMLCGNLHILRCLWHHLKKISSKHKQMVNRYNI